MRQSSIVTLLFLGLISTTEAIKIKGQEEEVEEQSTETSEAAGGATETKQLVALGEKLGLDVTEDMFVGQSQEDISNAIIGAALESGKSQAEIETAMSGGAAPAATQSAVQTESSTESAASTETATAAASDSSAGTLAPLEEVKVEVTK